MQVVVTSAPVWPVGHERVQTVASLRLPSVSGEKLHFHVPGPVGLALMAQGSIEVGREWRVCVCACVGREGKVVGYGRKR